MSIAREAAIWELEERQLHEKNQLAKRQLKDLFYLKRHQMLTRHEKVGRSTNVLKHILVLDSFCTSNGSLYIKGHITQSVHCVMCL